MPALELDVSLLGEVDILPVPTAIRDTMFTNNLPDGIEHEARVLFLDPGFNSQSVMHAGGRAGRILRGERTAGGRFGFRCDAGSTGSDIHQRVALLNPTVEIGEEVVILRQADVMSWNQTRVGHRARVTAVTARNITVDDIARGHHRAGVVVSHWAKATNSQTPGASAAVSQVPVVEQIPELPQYWEDRIHEIARAAKRSNGGWACSEIDRTVEKLLEPNRRYRVGSSNGTIIVRDPQGNEIASFSGGANPRENAEIYARVMNETHRPVA